MPRSRSKAGGQRATNTTAPGDESTRKTPASETKKQRETMPDEVAKAFDLYMHLGQMRTISRVAELIRKSSRQVERWSSTYNWQRRIELQRAEEQWHARQAAREEVIKLSRRRLRNADFMQQAAIRIIQQADLESLTPEEARKLLGTAHRWMLEGMKIERLETKDAREVDEIPHPPKPIQQMNDAELDAYIAQP